VVANARTIKPSADPDVLTVAGDITHPATAERITGAALDRFGRTDTLVVLVASGVSVCLSAVGVSLPALQESPGQVRDQVGLFVEGEVAGVDDVHLGARRIRGECLSRWP
jgi:hypothetical protein